MRLRPDLAVVLLTGAVLVWITLEPQLPHTVFSPPFTLQPQHMVPMAPQAIETELEGFSDSFDAVHAVTWHRPRKDLASDRDDIYLYFGSRAEELTEPMLHINRVKPKVEHAVEITVVSNEGTAHLVRRCAPGWRSESDNYTFAFGRATVANVAMALGILTHEEVAAIRMLARAEHAELHFVGLDATEKRRIPPGRLRSIRQVVETYEALTGVPWEGLPSRATLPPRSFHKGTYIWQRVPGC